MTSPMVSSNEQVLIVFAVVSPLLVARYCRWAESENKLVVALREAGKYVLEEWFGASDQELGEGGVL